MKVEAGDRRMDLVEAITEECLNEDRLYLSVDGVKPRR